MIDNCQVCEGLGRIDCEPDDGTHTHLCDTCRPEDNREFQRGVAYGESLRNDWHNISTAPVNKRILVRGNGIVRFGILDNLGNWRATHNGAFKTPPKEWMDVPQ